MVLFSNGCFHTLPDGCLLLCMCLCMYFHFFFFASAWREHIGAGLEMELREEKVKLRTEKKRWGAWAFHLPLQLVLYFTQLSIQRLSHAHQIIQLPCSQWMPSAYLWMLLKISSSGPLLLDHFSCDLLADLVCLVGVLWCWMLKLYYCYWPVFMEIKSYNSFN